MKFKLPNSGFLAALLASLALAIAPAARADDQTTPTPAAPPFGRSKIDPDTGLPIRNTIDPDTGLPISAGTVDPATGLPVPWKAPNWVDPDKVLPEIRFNDMPVAEIAKNLREVFKGAFDVLLPNDSDRNWKSEPVSLELKDVRASEVFNAMNLLFENNRTPLRWELKVIGQRQVALLRVLEEPRVITEPKHEEPKRNIFFVGDLIGDGRSGGMSMQQLVQTVSEIFDMSYPQGGFRGPGRGGFPGTPKSAEVIRFHEGAQLLIVTGTADQIQFVQQTLFALRDKAHLEQRKTELKKEQEQKPKSSENKPQPGETPH